MLKISRLADYATLIMSCFAKQPRARYSAAILAQKTQIALPTVSKILKLLSEAGLLISKRGVNGGYELATKPERISVAAIVTAIDGEFALTECSQATYSCQQNHTCELSGNWQFINQVISDLLESISLVDMTHSVESIPIHFYQNKSELPTSESML